MMWRGILLIFALTLGCEAQSLEDGIKFEFFYGSAFDPRMTLFNLDNIGDVVDHPGFRSSARTVIFHFDEEDYDRQQQVTEIITSYLYTNVYNIIMVVYDDPTVVSDANALAISNFVANAMRTIFARGYDASLMHLLGKGVGANILSHAAASVIPNGFFVSRLSALNPTRLTSAVALFIDVVYTEGYVEGGAIPTFGRADYVVNTGIHPQPGCGGQTERCSREFAMRIWSESVRSHTAIFPCLRCDTWELFLNGDCNENTPIGHLGLHASPNLVGRFMVQTNTRDPWTRNTPLPNV